MQCSEIPHMDVGGKAEPFLLLSQASRLGRIITGTCLQWLKPGATPPRSVSLLQKCFFADKIRR